MLLAGVSAFFAYIFATFTQYAFPRGKLFLAVGWEHLQAYGEKAKLAEDVKLRLAISEGAWFFVGGILWLVGALVSGFLTLYFIIRFIGFFFGF